MDKETADLIISDINDAVRGMYYSILGLSMHIHDTDENINVQPVEQVMNDIYLGIAELGIKWMIRDGALTSMYEGNFFDAYHYANENCGVSHGVMGIVVDMAISHDGK